MQREEDERRGMVIHTEQRIQMQESCRPVKRVNLGKTEFFLIRCVFG